MPPNNSEFVFDTQAWASLSATMAMQKQQQTASANYVSKPAYGLGGGCDANNEDAWGSPVVTNPSAGSGGGDNTSFPPSPMNKSKSSPSLASLLRQKNPHLPFKADARQTPMVNATRSKSFAGSKNNSDKRNSNNPEVVTSRRAPAVNATRSRSFTSRDILRGELEKQQIEYNEMKCCDVHPQVRLRSNRCPRCAAAEMKKTMIHRRSLGNIAPLVMTSPAAGGVSSSDDEQSIPASYDSHSAGEGGNEEAGNASIVGEDDEEIEEVSLDPKWAEALRGISLRLASERAQESTAEEDPADQEDDNSSYQDHLPPSMRQQPLGRTTQSIDELHRLLQATKPSIEEDDDDISRSSIAMNTPVVAKTFAESKDQSTPPKQGLHSSRQYKRHSTPHPRQYDEDPPSAMDRKFNRNFTDISIRQTSGDASCQSSGSDESSVTCSVASGYTLESFNSLRGPPTSQATRNPFASSLSQALGPARLNDTYNSPTTVVDTKNLYSERRTYSEDHDEEDSESLRQAVDEEQEDFESSFFMSAPKSYAEEKMSTPALGNNHVNGNPTSATKAQDSDGAMDSGPQSPTMLEATDDYSGSTANGNPAAQPKEMSSTMIDGPVSHNYAQQVLVEDVTSDSDEDDVATTLTPYPDKVKAPTPTTSQNKTRDDSSPAAADMPKQQQRRSSSKKENRHPSKVALDESKDDERTAKASRGKPAAPPTKSQPSFFSALVHNSRSRSCSRSRQTDSRSKSRSRKDGRSKSRGRKDGRSKSLGRKVVGVANAEAAEPRKSKMDKKLGKQGGATSKSSKTVVGEMEPQEVRGPKSKQSSVYVHQPIEEPRSQDSVNEVTPEEVSYPMSSNASSPQEASDAQRPPSEEARADYNFISNPARKPITHPHYKLGDQARDEDMIIFPKVSRHNKRRHRSRRRRGREEDDSSSSDSDEDDDDYDEDRAGRSRKCFRKVDIWLAIGELQHLDAAFVRRSDGNWTYALVADGNSDEIRFVVNDRGSTKSFPKSLWKSSVRRIRVLTQRTGDKMVVSTKPIRKKRSLTRSRSFRNGRGGSKGGRRLVSPSPTRRNSGVLNLPPTIMEGRVYN